MLANLFLCISAFCFSFTDPGRRELRKKERERERERERENQMIGWAACA
jgi:hypothetical protein